MAKPTPTEAPAKGFDDILADLRIAVEKLESGELTLEQALSTYETGIGLARAGQHLLDSAQQRIELLALEGDGQVSATPFDETPT